MRKRGVIRGKKGESEYILIKVFGLLLAAGAFVALLAYWREVKDDTFLEKTYLARDLGMLVTTAYASPGDLVYCYYGVEKYREKFDYSFADSVVTVKDHKGNEKATYRYVQDNDRPVPVLEVKGKDSEELALLMVTKAGNRLKVGKKLRGENAEPCKP